MIVTNQRIWTPEREANERAWMARRDAYYARLLDHNCVLSERAAEIHKSRLLGGPPCIGCIEMACHEMMFDPFDEPNPEGDE